MDNLKINSLENKEHYQSLLIIYGKLLTDYQRTIVSEYLAEDFSLSEVSEIHGISRNAVWETIKRVFKKLDIYEKELNLSYKYHQINNKLDIITNKENEEVIKEIKELINYGIWIIIRQDATHL